MSNKTKFYLIAFWCIGAVLVMFIPTGVNGEWVFLDYFHAWITVPISGFFFWKFYKKI